MSPSRLPILFIPGLFGCMSSQIVPHTGSWQFGFAKSMYLPFIDLLVTQGFMPSQDLFVLYYDWQQTISHNVKTYLLPLIEKIKHLTHQNTFNVISHGTGGLIARYYLQSNEYNHDIHHLFLIATPNSGFSSVFPYFTGGELDITCKASLDFISLYLRMHLYKRISPTLPLPDTLLTHFPALGELIPSKHFSDYLYLTWSNNRFYVPYKYMIHQNTFLDQLNQSYDPTHYPHTTLHLIAGDGYNTMSQFEIMPLCTSKKWLDGKVIDCDYSTEGDGVSLIGSVLSITGNSHILQSHYESILLDSSSIYLPLINQ